jgi:pimeloyl-ACP methyl ester carboxylesterase
LIGELGLEKPVIMGHSMGAGTAANVAVKYPDLPGAIILEDPPWGVPPAGAQNEEARKQSEAFRSFLMGLRKLTLEGIVSESRKNDPTWAEEERLPWARAKQQFDPSLFARPVINPRPYTEIVPLIRCPTLLVCAENGIVSAETAEKAVRLWRSEKPFRWVRIERAGHNIRREKFEEFFGAVASFLREAGNPSHASSRLRTRL